MDSAWHTRYYLISILSVICMYCVVVSPDAARAMDGCICNGSSSCYPDGCTRKTIKNDGSLDYNLCATAGCGGVYNSCYINGNLTVAKYFCVDQPPCCADMVARNLPDACCWPERAFCHPVTICSKLSNPERCGWYWTFHQDWTNRPEGYGCMKGNSADSMVPIFGLPAGVPGGNPTAAPSPTSPPAPTTPPQPTTPPYVPPTDIPAPTAPPLPTAAPINLPIGPGQPTAVPPTSVPFSIGSSAPSQSSSNPSLSLPVLSLNFTLPVKAGLRRAVLLADNGLRPIGETAYAVRKADAVLEYRINSFISGIILSVRKYLKI